MKPPFLYQPFLLRCLHGITGLCLVLAMVTAAWTYNTYDGRWGQLPLPNYQEIEGIHGTFGLYTLLIFPAFVFYAFRRGHKRLGQADSLPQLTQKIGTPVWWYTLSRCVNTVTLLALTFALFSGKMMDEKWLPQGELDHFWYYGHLISWVVMGVAIALHLLMNAKVGGIPFLLSMLNSKFLAQDSPKLWKNHILAWWSNTQLSSWSDPISIMSKRPKLELIIWFSLIAAWLISLTKELLGLLNTVGI
ncbi:cytochrome b/b6 domain-containing protein [Leptothoe kymatousa]|uniref:Cytochrome b/b6 domain-containing protein n=1 Tax=Leptothoe kymatousa TAU-MAC 1615 TaxID=2364775 RepID=A0ABS5Y6T5_9CYAN|nr:cytochrome b/b6 domain-containing protein [Leptothoe kymatousa]MBT9313579.1 cytochrome b/b6 domain-containing protein [Leptothoe kymatousa TAU-MAC 1615]